jgi:hypothetical protein
VLGGFHLAGPRESIISDTIEALGKFNLEVIAAAHCTGWRAIGALATQFGNRVVPSAATRPQILCLRQFAGRTGSQLLPKPAGSMKVESGRQLA